MQQFVTPLSRLVEQFEKLPGIGKKSAQRLAFYVLSMPKEQSEQFAQAILDAKEKIKHCSQCCDLTDEDTCAICKSDRRDRSVICVVEDPKDVAAFEKTREYKGLYHVLHGVISPMDGIEPEMLKIKELLTRLGDNSVKEVIMATNPTIEGETTAMYISRLIKPLNIKVTRLAYGIPVGGELEYADEMTLMRAIEGRREI
ncbi:MAG: recombination protein RecR [Ruminococcaceae bacterium]|nr:recombination protein RecR [Oscillospiraceae bacterium]